LPGGGAYRWRFRKAPRSHDWVAGRLRGVGARCAVPGRAGYADATGWAAGLSLQPLAQLQGLADGLAHPPFGPLCTA
jgi:hypothetical protein